MLEVTCLTRKVITVRLGLVFPGVSTNIGPVPINSIISMQPHPSSWMNSRHVATVLGWATTDTVVAPGVLTSNLEMR